MLSLKPEVVRTLDPSTDGGSKLNPAQVTERHGTRLGSTVGGLHLLASEFEGIYCRWVVTDHKLQ